jgi:hypothetical protein
MNKQFKIWPVLRDVIIVIVLSFLGGFIVGFASTDHSSQLYIYSIGLSNSLFCIIGFTISGCLAVGNRWRHLAIVAAIVWVVSIFNVILSGVTIVQWAGSAIAIAISTLIGGGISLLFKRKSLVEISSNAEDDKFYDQVARELQEKPMVPGLWTKAFAEMDGDDAKARALYINLRVGQLHTEATLENERQNAETKKKAKEERLAAEAAKPPIKRYEKLANILLGCFCGCATLLFALLIIGCLSDLDRAGLRISFSEILEHVKVVIGLGAIAFAFGFITYKCFRAVMR